MYTVTVKGDFVAQHYLVGGDWGEENQKHSHHYRVEIQLEGAELDRHGYLADIKEIESHLNAVVLCYKDRSLNDLPEFEGLNPSIERFAFILCRKLSERIMASNIEAITVRVWENDIACASCKQMK